MDLTFEQAMAIMRAGGKVRRKSWSNGGYLHISNRADDATFNYFQFFEKVTATAAGSVRPFSATPYNFAHDDIIAATWVEVT